MIVLSSGIPISFTEIAKAFQSCLGKAHTQNVLSYYGDIHEIHTPQSQLNLAPTLEKSALKYLSTNQNGKGTWKV